MMTMRESHGDGAAGLGNALQVVGGIEGNYFEAVVEHARVSTLSVNSMATTISEVGLPCHLPFAIRQPLHYVPAPDAAQGTAPG
jgi:hypothetical protein